MNVAAKKQEPEIPAVKIPEHFNSRRFYLPDISDKGLWLVERLRARYPHLQDNNIVGWLRGAIDSNEYLFIRTEHAFAMAQMMRETLSPHPIVFERFMLHEEGTTKEETALYLAEAKYLYGEMMKWAANVGAREVVVEQWTDVKTEDIKDAVAMVKEVLAGMSVTGVIARLFQRTQYVIRLGS